MAGKQRISKAMRRQRRRRVNAKRRVPVRGGRGDASMLRGIKQGTGKSVANAFGSTRLRGYHPCHHDAFHHAHLPLPRAVGPYSVIRTTQYIEDRMGFTVIGPYFDFSNERWSDVCGVGFNDVNKTVGDAGNTTNFVIGSLRSNPSWRGAQVVPAAMSVQIMNPEPLQTSTGIIYVGRLRTALRLNEDRSVKVDDLANQCISYNNPRLCAAAKLALRGVQVDLVPFNMSELANFTLLSSPTWSQYGATSPAPKGFAPMFIYNPNNVKLQLLVAIEWRTRFDPSNPAQASHEHHPPATESMWAQAQHTAEMLGNGVVDIADKVANVGNAVYNAAGSAYGAMRGLRALRAAAPMLAIA